MDMDFLNKIPGALAKGKPHWKVVEEIKGARATVDDKESRKVRKRSKGICEVVVAGKRCTRRAFHVHHRKGGHGRRGRGESALAKHKDHVCAQCHERIGKTLKHVRGHHYREAAC